MNKGWNKGENLQDTEKLKGLTHYKNQKKKNYLYYHIYIIILFIISYYSYYHMPNIQRKHFYSKFDIRYITEIAK